MKAFAIVKLLDVSEKNFPALIIAIKTTYYSLEVRPSTDRNPFTESRDIAGVFVAMEPGPFKEAPEMCSWRPKEGISSQNAKFS